MLNFTDILKRRSEEPAEPDEIINVQASDRERLSMGLYLPKRDAQAVLVFYHGGGAHMLAGYEHLARQLVDAIPVVVVTPDLRGHGISGGRRGYAGSADVVWSDMEVVDSSVRARFPNLPLFVGGHSSGAGLVLNGYATRREHTELPIAGVVLLAPYLSASAASKPASGGGRPFARGRTWVFAVNLISRGRLAGRIHAVKFDYSKEMVESRGMVAGYSAGMAFAVTPMNALEKLGGISVPVSMIAARSDTLFPESRLRSYSQALKQGDEFLVIDGDHLGCLLTATDAIKGFMEKHVPGLRETRGQARQGSVDC